MVTALIVELGILAASIAIDTWVIGPYQASLVQNAQEEANAELIKSNEQLETQLAGLNDDVNELNAAIVELNESSTTSVIVEEKPTVSVINNTANGKIQSEVENFYDFAGHPYGG